MEQNGFLWYIVPYIPMAVGLLAVFLNSYYHIGIKPNRAFSFMFFLSGFTGIIWAFRQEAPMGRGFAPAIGNNAILVGVIWTLTMWYFSYTHWRNLN